MKHALISRKQSVKGCNSITLKCINLEISEAVSLETSYTADTQEAGIQNSFKKQLLQKPLWMIVYGLQNVVKFMHLIAKAAGTNKCYAKYVFWKVF